MDYAFVSEPSAWPESGWVHASFAETSPAIIHRDGRWIAPGISPRGAQSETLNGYRLHRDQLRKGWWVAPESVRYVAVESVPEGQRNAPFGQEWNAREVAEGRCGDPAGYEWSRDAEEGWAVIDLHDLGPEKTTSVLIGGTDESPRERARRTDRAAAEVRAEAERRRAQVVPPSPRYVVLEASEMEEGRTCEPCNTEHRASSGADDLNAERATPHPLFWKAWDGLGSFGLAPARYAIVDTHDGWQGKAKVQHGYANCVPHGPGEPCRPVYPAKPEPQGPSDAEIVAAWEAWARQAEGLTLSPLRNSVHVHGVAVLFSEYQAARSRELKRRVETSKERERQRIGCEGTLPEDY